MGGDFNSVHYGSGHGYGYESNPSSYYGETHYQDYHGHDGYYDNSYYGSGEYYDYGPGYGGYGYGYPPVPPPPPPTYQEVQGLKTENAYLKGYMAGQQQFGGNPLMSGYGGGLPNPVWASIAQQNMNMVQPDRQGSRFNKLYG